MIAVRSPDELLARAGAPPLAPMVETVVRALYAQPPKHPDQLAAWRSVSRAAWRTSPATLAVLCIGRRGLKSYTLALIAVHEAIAGDHDEHAAPGTRVYFVIVAPELRQAREVTRAVRAHLDALAPLGVTYSVADPSGVPEITITNPTSRCERVITILTASATSVRGFAVAFVGLDEAGFLPNDSHLNETGRDIYRALRAATAQFPNAKTIVASTPGQPHGLFFDLVSKPPRDAVLVRAPTWIFNPAIDRATCERIAGDRETFEQEFAVSRFGAAGETFLDSAAVARCRTDVGPFGPRPGLVACVGADASAVGDDAAIVVCTYSYRDTGNGTPIQYVRTEHVEFIEASRTKPIAIEAFAQRVAAVAKAFGDAPVRHDVFAGHDLRAHLERLGVRSEIVRMDPAAQTTRWRKLRDLVTGGRLAIVDDANGAKLTEQLSNLRATQLSSGALRVEGKKDDGADALALALEGALARGPSTSDGGTITFDVAPCHWSADTREIIGGHRRWFRVHPNGHREPLPPPRGTPEFERHVEEAIRRGAYPPDVAAHLEEQQRIRIALGGAGDE